jgi:uncharacterized damage-inducible protein DinB
MINPDYPRMMSYYNSEMNRRLYAAASRLTDAERKQDRGAFWASIHGTLNHLLWGDRQWMWRFAGWDRPSVAQGQSTQLYEDFNALWAARARADMALEDWAATIDQAWLDQDLVWFSGSTRKEMRAPRVMLLPHLFNHQTHHRGQVHAMLTAAGQATGDTDLFIIMSERTG